VKSLPIADVLERTRREEVPSAKLLSIGDIFEDPQYQARGNLIEYDDPRVGPLTLPAPLPRMSKTPPVFRNAGPALGDGNQRVFGKLLGLAAETIADLKARGTI
jgi:crotonobetainyl-CoA:carnitine CoA-transferase CaiB-like acyl-CoA transferase